MPIPSRRTTRALAGRHFRRENARRPVRPAWLPGASAGLTAAVLLAGGIPAAHAQLTRRGDAPAQTEHVTAPGPAIGASADTNITFPRTAVGTRPAQITATVVTSPGLRPPLAALSVTSRFGYRTSPITGGAGELHTGLDLVASCQTAVFAAGSGTVIEAGWSPYGGGNRIVVDHGNGIKSTYNHLSSIEISVGATVEWDERLAAAGMTGNSTGCHLHFEVVRNGLTVDPQRWVQP